MSRRRRLLIVSTDDSEDNTEDTTESQPKLSDHRRHDAQIWRFKKETAVHPVLTNYGPESLQCFLRDELETLRNQALSQQRRQILHLARSLVNYPGNLCIVRDTPESFSIVPATVSIKSHETTDKGKGKAPVTPVRKSLRRKPVVDIAHGDLSSWKDKTVGARGALQTLINNTARPFDRSKSKAVAVTHGSQNAIGSALNSDVDTISTADVRRPDVKFEPSQSDGMTLRNVDSHQNIPPITHTSFHHSESQALPTTQQELQPGTCRMSSPIDRILETVDDFSQPSGVSARNIDLPPLDPDSQITAAMNSDRLIRTASFETHADNTRDSRRSRDGFPVSLERAFEDSQRRRKTPSYSQGTPASSLPSASAIPPSRNAGQGRVNFFSVTEGMEDAPFVRVPLTSASPERSTEALAAQLLYPQEPQRGSYSDDDLDRDLLMFDFDEDDMSEGVCDDPLEQQAILASINDRSVACDGDGHETSTVMTYSYNRNVPEDLPINFKQAASNRETIWQAHGHDSRGTKQWSSQSEMTVGGPFTIQQLDPMQENILNGLDNFGDYKRTYEPFSAVPRLYQPSLCSSTVGSRNSLPHEIWEAGVLEYLSSNEVRSLRLVSKNVAEDLEPYVFRSVVTKFGPSFFEVNTSSVGGNSSDTTGPDSMLEKFGPGINKFGIAFEYDHLGMTHAPFKVTETDVDAWFGNYKWPVKEYPYFASLREIDALLDDQPRLLTQAMRNLHNCHELALSVDSGHGWLEGPDMSDLALYRHRAAGGSRVFGKTFSATDRACEEGMAQLFEWAQRNTINENIKSHERSDYTSRQEIERLRDIFIRDYDSYRVQSEQPDFEKDLHTGQGYTTTVAQANNLNGQAIINPFPAGNLAAPPPPFTIAPGFNRRRRQRFTDVLRIVADRTSSSKHAKDKSRNVRNYIQPQWPLVYNGYNVSADVGGDSDCIQERMASPSEHPLLPGSLNEAQAQWIMETSWIQRTFLSSYTDAIRTNAAVFKNVHSLHVSKISSGLLSSLSQKEFWSSLPDLKKLTILVKPDWRVEHVPGDKFFQTTMNTRLTEASMKFADLLRETVACIEHLNSLHIGYCSGGEHQKGMFGRNQHVLPAPVTSNPRAWVLAQNPINPRPEENTMFNFPHVRNLTFENCWFSPLMLETFMQKSQDSSLHNLVLDSVSLTARINSTRTDGPLRTFETQLNCVHPPGAWLQETIPANASWISVLDKITPGQTIQDQKYDAGMINEEEVPRPEFQFRGNIQKITVNSCGYVKIHNIASTEFNQNELVFHSIDWNSEDEGLKLRAARFNKTVYSSSSNTLGTDEPSSLSRLLRLPLPYDNDRDRAARFQELQAKEGITTKHIMQGGQTAHDLLKGPLHVSASGSIHMTGFLTQCIHPVEKRILEQNWGMTFGWSDDMRRWEAVEDGWFIGGTGRFSGNVYKSLELQEREKASRVQENAKAEESTEKEDDETPVKGPAAGTRSGRNFFSNLFGMAGPSRTSGLNIAEEGLSDDELDDGDDLQFNSDGGQPAPPGRQG